LLASFIGDCKEMDVQSMTVFLAYLASHDYNEEAFVLMENKIVEDITGDLGRWKVHDMARILWSFSSTAHQCSESFIKLVSQELQRHLQSLGARGNLLKTGDALKSLVILGSTPLPCCRHMLRMEGSTYSGYQKKKLAATVSQLQWLLAIEHPLEFQRPSTLIASVEEKQLLQRPLLLQLQKLLLSISPKSVNVSIQVPVGGLSSASVCIVPNAMFQDQRRASLEDQSGDLSKDETDTLSKDDTEALSPASRELRLALGHLSDVVAVEAIDGYSCVNMLSQPATRRQNGATRCKLRLMRALNIQYVLVEDSEEGIDEEAIVKEILQQIKALQ